LLEENAGLKFENTGMNAMANTDKAGEYIERRNYRLAAFVQLNFS